MLFAAFDEGLLPAELAMLCRAFDGMCAELRLDREEGNEAQREYIAMLILKLAGHGLMDEATLRTAVTRELPIDSSRTLSRSQTYIRRQYPRSHVDVRTRLAAGDGAPACDDERTY